MKNTLLFSLLILTLTSCWEPTGEYLSEEDRKYLKQLKPFPLTEKEKNYKEELEKMGLKKVELQRPFYPEDYAYEVTFYSDQYYNWRMKDSVSNFATEIALNLYSEILEDRVIYGLGVINVNIFFKSKKDNSNSIKFRQNIPSIWIEKKLGYEVKKIADDYYSRKSIDPNEIYEGGLPKNISIQIYGYKRED